MYSVIIALPFTTTSNGKKRSLVVDVSMTSSPPHYVSPCPPFHTPPTVPAPPVLHQNANAPPPTYSCALLPWPPCTCEPPAASKRNVPPTLFRIDDAARHAGSRCSSWYRPLCRRRCARTCDMSSYFVYHHRSTVCCETERSSWCLKTTGQQPPSVEAPSATEVLADVRCSQPAVRSYQAMAYRQVERP